MKKPDIDLSTLSIGKIFQISPEGSLPFQVKFGGDFLISTAYHDEWVTGYVANVFDAGQLPRIKGMYFLHIPWEQVECVGCAYWFKDTREKDGEIESK